MTKFKKSLTDFIYERMSQIEVSTSYYAKKFVTSIQVIEIWAWDLRFFKLEACQHPYCAPLLLNENQYVVMKY